MNKGYTATEKQFMDALIETAQYLNYMVCHIPDRLYALAAKEGRYDAMAGATGFPDIIAIGHGHLFVIETKSATGKTSFEQDAWLDRFCEWRYALCDSCSENIHIMKARPEHQDEIIALMKACREESWNSGIMRTFGKEAQS